MQAPAYAAHGGMGAPWRARTRERPPAKARRPVALGPLDPKLGQKVRLEPETLTSRPWRARHRVALPAQSRWSACWQAHFGLLDV